MSGNETIRKFKIISAIANSKKPSLQDISELSKVPTSTLKRQISSIQELYGMEIRFVREANGQRGQRGFYYIADWGIFDVEAYILKYGLII